MAEVGVDVMRSRIIELRLCGVHQDRHQASEAPEGEVEHEGELEAHQQGQRARGVQGAAAARHSSAEITVGDSRKMDGEVGGEADEERQKERGGEGGRAEWGGTSGEHEVRGEHLQERVGVAAGISQPSPGER